MRLALPLLLLAAACSNGLTALPLTGVVGSGFEAQRPDDAPDYVVLSVSGRNFEFDLFCPPDCNEAYIDDPGSAAEAIIDDLMARGHTVEAETYIAALYNYDDDGDGAFDERLGFAQLVLDLQWIHANWVEGFENPAKIVLIGHSHGCVWAHLATGALPEIQIDVLISMDGECTLWEFDHQEQIRDYFADIGGNPFPFDISAPCERWDVPGVGIRDTEDVVFDNVVFNIEVRANGDLIAQDEEENRRLDGSEANIVRFDSANDDHLEVLEATSESMAFVLAQLALLTAPAAD